MPIIKLVKSISGIFQKKKRGYPVVNSELRLRGGVEDPGKFKPRKFRLEKLKQKLFGNKKDYPEEFGRSPSKPPFIQLGLIVLVVVGIPFVWLNGGGDKVKESLYAINFFKINKVEVFGSVAVSKDRVLDASGVVLHQSSMLGISGSEIETRVKAIPWVAHVGVKKNWPDKVEITIEENAPIAILHNPETTGMQLQYLDNNGVAFSMVSPGAEIDFPVITGLSELTDYQLKERATADILAFLRKVASNDPHLPAHSVSEIHISNAGEMVIYLVDYPFPIFFGNGNTKQKYSRLIQVLRALYKKQNGKELLAQIEYIQMDYANDKVLVVEKGSGQ